MKNLFSAILVGATFVMGCGGGGGLDSSAVVGTLSTADAMALCNQLAADYPQKTVTCGSDTEMPGIPASECSGSDFEAPPASCTATVGQYEDCLAADYDDPCGSNGSATAAACAPLVTDGCEGD
jgi:hypothetical protein